MLLNIILNALIYSLVINIIFFIIAFSLKTDKFTDLTYALTFVILAFVFAFKNQPMSRYDTVLVSMVTLWGLRLGGFLFYRVNKIKRDKRFDNVRENFVKFFAFWLLQAISVAAIILPTLLAFNSNLNNINLISLVGVLVFIFGLGFEAIADFQKFNFKQNNKDKWVDTGLWSISRHPNYFGEITLWWGVYLYSLPALNSNWFIALLGPVYITILLIFVSGIPPLEKSYNKKYKNNKYYKKYKKNTPILVPFHL